MESWSLEVRRKKIIKKKPTRKNEFSWRSVSFSRSNATWFFLRSEKKNSTGSTQRPLLETHASPNYEEETGGKNSSIKLFYFRNNELLLKIKEMSLNKSKTGMPRFRYCDQQARQIGDFFFSGIRAVENTVILAFVLTPPFRISLLIIPTLITKTIVIFF